MLLAMIFALTSATTTAPTIVAPANWP